ncbi:hypothetical protein BJ742DRAFT_567240 [Cladochytrium replicatum]|nr:hypothetical protein BJ742DRAFT_567240 [Cladochytrium replicatum]
MLAAAAFLLALVASASAQTVVTNKWCNTDNSYCVQSAFLPDKNAVIFSVSTTATGWVAMGIGQGMADADIWLGWNLADGTQRLSDRTSKGRVMPTADATTTLSSVNATASINAALPPVAGHKTRLLFARALTATAPNKNIAAGQQSYLWAYGTAAPATPTSAFSNITKHAAKGTFTIDFTVSSTGGGAQDGATGTGNTTGTTSPAPSAALGFSVAASPAKVLASVVAVLASLALFVVL